MKAYKETCYEHKGYMIKSIPGYGKKEWVIDDDMFTKPLKTSDGRHIGIAQIMYFRLKDAKAALDRFQQTGTIIDELGGIVEKEEKKDKNKQETTQRRDELIAEGYTPCKRCNP